MEILYGRHSVREALRAGRRQVHRLLLAEGVATSPIISDIIAQAKALGIPIIRISRKELTQVARSPRHQGTALEVSPYPYVTVAAILGRAARAGSPPLILLLDLVQDVHNLGSLIRTAEAAGVHGVILQGKRAAGITPAAVNASSGATEHLYIAQVTNLGRAIQQLKDQGIWIAGLEDCPEAQPYTEVDLTLPLGLVIGSEAEGLRRLVRAHCDWLLRIPMFGQINSLNAAVAGSIALYEAVRQRTVASRSTAAH